MTKRKLVPALRETVLAADATDDVPMPVGPRFGYKQAARYLGVKEGTLRVLVSRKQVPHVRLGARLVVFDRESLDAHIKANTVGGSR